jgi:hypothetical protein
MKDKEVTMKITEQWLEEKSACSEGVEWFFEQKETEGIRVVKKLIKEKQLNWANWLIVRVMNYKQYVSYAVFAAEQVIDIFEKKYPNDKRPREAIEAAKKCIEDPIEENKKAAYAYAAAATAAAAAAYATAATAAATYDAYAAYAATTAATAATAAATYDAYAAYAAYAAATYDAYDAYAACAAALKLKILEYGVKLLEKL